MTRVATLPSSYPPSLGGVEELTRHRAMSLVDAGDRVEACGGTPHDALPATADPAHAPAGHQLAGDPPIGGHRHPCAVLVAERGRRFPPRYPPRAVLRTQRCLRPRAVPDQWAPAGGHPAGGDADG